MRDDEDVMQQAASHHGVVDGAQAAASGLTRSALHRRTATGHLVRCRPRVFRAAGAQVTSRGELLAAVLWAGDGALASHRSAAVLWQLDGREPGPVEVVVPAARAPRDQRGVRVDRMTGLEADDRSEIYAPVTGIALTIIHLASYLRAGQLATALDSALARGLTRPDQVLERLDALLVRAGMPAAVRQFEIVIDGKVATRTDLALPEVRIAIGADGYRWHGTRSSWQRDLARRTELAGAGWLVLHFSWRDLVERPQFVVAQVARAVTTRKVCTLNPGNRV